MKAVITGATGYIGSRLAALATKRGYDVIPASRRRPASSVQSWIHLDLASDESIELPVDTDVVFHLAANTSDNDVSNDFDELAAARRLSQSARNVGARFIFISSQTARVDAPTAYGRIKWNIEQDVLAAAGWVVRPGQVYGGELRGLYGSLVGFVRALPMLPAFMPAPRVQPIHIDDLVEGLLRIAERSDVPCGIYSLAAPAPVLFSNFLGEIAGSRLRLSRFLLPAPIPVINFCAAAVGPKWRGRLGLDRLSSLFSLPAMETAHDLNLLGLVLRPLAAGLHPSGDDRRRRLLLEGRSLLAYILKARPGGAMLRRYVRAIETLRGGKELGLRKIFLSTPVLLSLLDKKSWPDAAAGNEFSWRLDAATLLAEASPAGVDRFLGARRSPGLFRVLLSMTLAMINEVLWRVARMLVLLCSGRAGLARRASYEG